MRALYTLQVPLFLKRDKAVSSRRLLDADAIGERQRSDGSTGFRDQTQSLVISSRENAHGFRVREFNRRGAYEHREIPRCGDVADHTSRILILAVDEQSEIAVSTGLYVFADRHDHVAQNPWCRASRAQLENTEHRTMPTVRGHESLNNLIGVRIVPNDGPGDRRNALHLEVNGIRHPYISPM